MKLAIALVVIALSSAICLGQQENRTERTIIFALLDGGKTLEPIAFLKDNALEGAIDGAQEPEMLADFHKRYFKPRKSYQLIFGGTNAGTVAIKSSDPNLECERHTAKPLVVSTRTKLAGNVMALATSSSLKVSGSGVRRAPTASERATIDSIVRQEFVKHKIGQAALKTLRSMNLTAVDVNNDDLVEFIGSYWVKPTAKSRSLLFFVAEKIGIEYQITFSDFGTVKEADTMSNDITVVDTGLGHELLIDVLDYDNDGSAEIFTYEASFEGAGFNVYRKEGAKWNRVFEGVNYRCAY